MHCRAGGEPVGEHGEEEWGQCWGLDREQVGLETWTQEAALEDKQAEQEPVSYGMPASQC